MSILHTIHCNHCGLSLLNGSGVVTYARRPAGWLRRLLGLGERMVPLPDPLVGRLPRGADACSLYELIEKGRLGCASPYFCPECLKIEWRENAEKALCRRCKKGLLVSVFKMVDRTCPKCNRGTIIKKIAGIT